MKNIEYNLNEIFMLKSINILFKVYTLCRNISNWQVYKK